MKNDIVCWWSGGITSAVACYLAIDLFGLDRCEFIFLDTKNEHDDTYRFKEDCEKWYGKEIKTFSAIPTHYTSIEDVWVKHKSLNTASGAICSTQLKRVVRERWQKEAKYTHQVFGFEFTKHEFKRAYAMKNNHPKAKAIFPLQMYGLSKEDCFDIVENAGIEIPVMYKLGFNNNNCFKTGCVQGGIGYWLKIKKEYPETFDRMAEMEHKLSIEKGQPVTILKYRKGGADELMFLKHCPSFSNKDLSVYDGREFEFQIESLGECNGFCGVDDLIDKTSIEQQLNLAFDL